MIHLVPLLLSLALPAPQPQSNQRRMLAMRHLVSLRRDFADGHRLATTGLLIRRTDKGLVVLAPASCCAIVKNEDQGPNLLLRFSRSEAWVPAHILRAELPGLPSLALLWVRSVEYPAQADALFRDWSGAPGLPLVVGSQTLYPTWDPDTQANLFPWHRGQLLALDPAAADGSPRIRFRAASDGPPMQGNPLFDSAYRFLGMVLRPATEEQGEDHLYECLPAAAIAQACAAADEPFSFPPDPLRAALEAAASSGTPLALCVVQKTSPALQEWAALQILPGREGSYPCTLFASSGRGKGHLLLREDGIRLELPRRPKLFFKLEVFASEERPYLSGDLVLGSGAGERRAWLALPLDEGTFAASLLLRPPPSPMGKRSVAPAAKDALRFLGDPKALSMDGKPLRFPIDVETGSPSAPPRLLIRLPEPPSRAWDPSPLGWRLQGRLCWSDLAPVGEERAERATGQGLFMDWEGGSTTIPVPSSGPFVPIDVRLPAGTSSLRLRLLRPSPPGFLRLEALRILPVPQEK